MKTGKVTKADLEQKIAAKADALKVDRRRGRPEVIQDAAQEPSRRPPARPPQPAPPGRAAGRRPTCSARPPHRRQIEEQRYRVLVDATIRRARQLLRTDPDERLPGPEAAARRDPRLRRHRRRRPHPDVADLEAVMREIFLKGAEIKRQAAAEREPDRPHPPAAQRVRPPAGRGGPRPRTASTQFRQLMQQARYELAYQEAQLMIQERISRGPGRCPPRPPPATSSASRPPSSASGGNSSASARTGSCSP